MEDLYTWLYFLVRLSLLLVVGIMLYLAFPDTINDLSFNWPSRPEAVVLNNVPQSSSLGLEVGKGKDRIEKHCLGCHSEQLIVQNRMNRESWENTIKWMQKTQGLWDLGSDEAIVVDYLATYYAPLPTGRRRNLDIKQIEWYILDSQQ